MHKPAVMPTFTLTKADSLSTTVTSWYDKLRSPASEAAPSYRHQYLFLHESVENSSHLTYSLPHSIFVRFDDLPHDPSFELVWMKA